MTSSYPYLAPMKVKSKQAFANTEDSSSSFIWNWKTNDANKKKQKKKIGKQFPVTEFLQESYRKVEEAVLGPGVGLGIGCGIGVGFGLVGGVGYGGWPWNHVKVVFGVGMGCGIGFGFGYGSGVGYGRSLESLQSQISKKSRADSNKNRILIGI